MYNNKSLLGHYWEVAKFDERLALYSSQKNQIPLILARLLQIRNIETDLVPNFLNSNIKNNIPNPFDLKDMNKSVDRLIEAIVKKQKIGIIADYDVDGSTSACILYKFLQYFSKEMIIKIPHRLTEGYGPNLRIMDEMLSEKAQLIFTLDCGISSFNIIDNIKYNNMDVIIIDHHLSDNIFPKVYSVINPNRYDEKNNFKNLAAVGVTFLFLMALRKSLRNQNFFKKNTEPNLISYLDMVALGTVCDVVNLSGLNRLFVKNGLEVIKNRNNKGITALIDSSSIKSTPNSGDLGFIIGPQLNAASRVGDSSLPSKLLISNNIDIIESISKKLILYNEKRKLIESNIYEEALLQAKEQTNNKFIIVFGLDWHSGVLGIVSSKLINLFNKPVVTISFINNIGIGSARSIKSIDLGRLIVEARNKKILLSGGGHKMAAGFKINYNELNSFRSFLSEKINLLPDKIFKKIQILDFEISVNEINEYFLDLIDKLEPFGSGNLEPNFIFKNLKIDTLKTIKDKHLMIFFQNDFSIKLKAFCFNCIGTALGDYLLNFKHKNLVISGNIRKDNFDNTNYAQIIIKDAMIID